jgi:hypothetical protein
MARDDQTPMNRDDREKSIINIDPDFYVPSGTERTNSYLRALRIMFPKITFLDPTARARAAR